MRLEKKCTELLAYLKNTPHHFTPNTVIPLIDLTLLDSKASCIQITALTKTAILHKTASICIFQKHLSCIPPELSLKCASVANFPEGNHEQALIMQTIDKARIDSRCCEIDYVFPYQMYLDGQAKEALQRYQEIAAFTKEYGLKIKVIIETGAFTSLEQIYKLCLELISLGCDFLKTSTGKIAQGASLPAAFAMLSAIKETNAPSGIKYSGGIKTATQAYEYMHLTKYLLNKEPASDWFRFGASSLLDELLLTQST